MNCLVQGTEANDPGMENEEILGAGDSIQRLADTQTSSGNFKQFVFPGAADGRRSVGGRLG